MSDMPGCDECQAMLIQTSPIYCCCPNGHGKLHQRPDYDRHLYPGRAYRRETESLRKRWDEALTWWESRFGSKKKKPIRKTKKKGNDVKGFFV